jgi:probable phosphoglycerate mutase
MTAHRLVLLRHARTDSNAEGRFQGHLDVELDDVGHAQAAAAAVVLGEWLAPDAARGAVRVVSSDLARAVQTAEPIVKVLGLDLTLDAALRERDGGTWQGLLRSEIAEAFPEEFARWTAGEDLQIGGGESLGQCWVRCEAGLLEHAEAVADDLRGTLVVVGHGASMRGGMMRMLGLLDGGPDDVARYRSLASFRNGHWAEVIRTASGWALDRFNVAAAP